MMRTAPAQIKNAASGQTTSQVYASHVRGSDIAPGLGDYADAVKEATDKAAKGDLSFASRTLAAQAMTLDAIFTEMARRMACNMGEYLQATETYARIAVKAQAGSRQAIEALAKLHQPREQTVRHVHVNEGGQAVIADQFHHHQGGRENGSLCGQPHATGTGAAGTGPALPCPNPSGNGVPIASREGCEAVPDARRQG
ncbi:hypothetical protein [Novosphingobium aerophilum]|nr:hypothetical protein [Novosphingobium aerophilum]